MRAVADWAPHRQAYMQALRWLPLVPAPFLDESFGSWLHRCAQCYVVTEFTFASAAMALDDKPPPSARCDWDTEPSVELLETLARHTPFRLAELRHLVHPKGPATLAPSMRDAYCPKCFADDQRSGLYYTRRAWLDAWSIWCPAHQCLLGVFRRDEYEKAPQLKMEPIEVLFGGQYEGHEHPLRVNPTVSAVPLPLQSHAADVREMLHRFSQTAWFDPAMMRSIVGRDLLMLMGSAAADRLYFELFGYPRLWNQVWHDADRRARIWPQIEHPLGGISIRIEAAFLASLLWHGVYVGSGIGDLPHAALLEVIRRVSTPDFQRQWMRTMIRRWARADRELWNHRFES
jgi:hypothetical protein